MIPTVLRRAVLGTLTMAMLCTAAARPATVESPASTDAGAAAQGPSQDGRGALRTAIWQLERSLRERLRATESGAGGILGAAPQACRDADRVPDLLDVMRRDGRKLGPDGAALLRKAAALRPLLHEVERREAAGASRVAPGSAAPGSAAPGSAWSIAAPSRRLDTTAASSCADALAVGDGQFAAAIGAAPSSSGGLWLRYTGGSDGMAVVSTAGSDFDTIVEVYDGCPAGKAPPLARGDDEVGLQARAAFAISAGETRWIHIAGWEGATGEAQLSTASGVSGFAGTVTREDGGHALTHHDVEVWTSAGSFVGSTETDSDGIYAFLGLDPGTYFASTALSYYDSDGLLDELYDDVPCAGGAPGGCDPTAGTPIVVAAGAILNNVDFALGTGAVVSGRVRDAATGLALGNFEVEVFGPTGIFIDDALTDVAGRYTISGLGNGTVYARAGGGYYGSQYGRELYLNIPCGSSACHVTDGTAISVAVGHTTTGIDFSLDKLGAIAGTVTRAQDGSAVTYTTVDVWDSQGHLWSYTYTDGAGHYSTEALDPGSYFVSTATWGDVVDELYDDLPCEPSCTPTSGTPITVTPGNTRPGVDFALRRMGSISGTITDAATGGPITYGYGDVYVYNAAGTLVTYGYSSGAAYTVSGVPAGTYYVLATHDFYRSELYNDVPCHGGPPSGCSLSAGTTVSVQLETTTGGINFALTRLGAISGTVADQTTGAALDDVIVTVWNSAGQYVAYQYTSAGAYKLEGLPAGTYFVTARRYDYVPKLYNGLACPGGGPPSCDPTTGTPVSVNLGLTTAGVSFALVHKGRVAGTVRDAPTGAPIDFAHVDVYNAAGAWVAGAYTYSGGTYEIDGLDAGNHFVVARASGHGGRLYNGLPCPTTGCSPTTGTPVPVALGATTGGIDLNLLRLGTITGLVRSDTGPLSGITVSLHAANGDWVGYTYTTSDGRYQLSAEEGTWFVMAGTGSFYAVELYPNIPCPNSSCNMASGTPVSVVGSGTTSGIDFELALGRGLFGCVRNEAAQPLGGVAIDLWNAAGSRVSTAVTGPNGCYQFLLSSAGTYFVSTDSALGLVDKLWNNISCPLGPAYTGGCDPTTGTPINLPTADTLVTGIDFLLDVGHVYVDGFETGDLAWSDSWPP